MKLCICEQIEGDNALCPVHSCNYVPAAIEPKSIYKITPDSVFTPITGLVSENFSNTPTSIAETRAHKTDDARKWTPRDVLISLLRDIDAGEIAPNDLIVCWNKDHKDGGCASSYRQAMRQPYMSVGLLERIKFTILQDSVSSR